jgi:hypothetical protein
VKRAEEFPPEAAAALVVKALLEVPRVGPKRARELCRDYLSGDFEGSPDPRFMAGFVDLMATPAQRKTEAFKRITAVSPFNKSRAAEREDG